MSQSRHLAVMTGSAALLVLLPLAAVLYLRKRRSKHSLPRIDQYERVGHVQQLYVYPIKACEGVPVDSLQATVGGLCTVDGLFDRSFCVVDATQKVLNSIRCRAIGGIHIRIVRCPNGTVAQQPTVDSCATVRVCIELSYPLEPEVAPILVPVWPEKPTDARILKGAFLNDHFEGVDCGDPVAEWLQHVLESPGARLVQHVPSIRLRPANSVNKHSAAYEQEFQIMYQNYCDLHLITKASILALNEEVRSKRSAESAVQVDGRNFRPNVLVDDSPGAWHEDAWKHVWIGGCVFEQIQNCFRCPNTTVSKVIEKENKETGLKRKRLMGTSEPLNTLRTFRRSTDTVEDQRVKGSPFFGCLMGTRKAGKFNVGDQVYAVLVDKI
jgi:uncharacterized protein YcbX